MIENLCTLTIINRIILIKGFMKTYIIAIVAAVCLVTSANAQQLKMGYTNVDYILAFMPETQNVQTQLTEYEGQLTAQIQSKYTELQQKVAEYEQGAAMMIDAVRADKEQEIQQLQVSLQQFQANAEVLVQQKQAQLLQPLYEKIQSAIDEVAAEGEYIVIFRSETLLFADQERMDEVSEQVFAKLGIEPPSAGTSDQ